MKLPALTKIRKFQDELVGETEPLTGDEQPQVENEEPQVPREKTEQVWVMKMRKVPFANLSKMPSLMNTGQDSIRLVPSLIIQILPCVLNLQIFRSSSTRRSWRSTIAWRRSRSSRLRPRWVPKLRSTSKWCYQAWYFIYTKKTTPK